MKLVPPVVERSFFAIVTPLVDALIRRQVRPNTLTTVGVGFVLLSALAFGFGMIRVGGLLLLVSGVVDTLDGAVARATGTTSKFGAFYDSTLDRVGDGATFMGIGAFLLTAEGVAFRVPAVLLCMVAILSSLVVSYARARAEGLGLECKVGIAQRAERILGLGIPSLIIGAGPRALVLEGIVAILTVMSVITVVQRFIYVHQITNSSEPVSRVESRAKALDSLAKGSER